MCPDCGSTKRGDGPRRYRRLVRVVTWNVLWRDGGNWRKREDGIVATLDRLQPDVVMLQEVWGGDGTNQADVLGRRLGLHSAFAAPSLPPPPETPESPDQVGIEIGVAVLSRWAIRRIQRLRLPSQHRAFEPVALVATLDHPAGPLFVVASCVEWEPEFADDQLAQTRALAALLCDPALDGPLPVILGADLNAGPGTAPVAVLTDVLVDTWVASGAADDGITLSSANPLAPLAAREQIDRRIDYVLARPGSSGRPVRVRRAAVVKEAVGGVPSSDHYAVVVDLGG